MLRQILTVFLALAVLAVVARMPLPATYLPASVGGGGHGGGGGGGHGKPPPIISNVNIPRVTHDSATITWTTDKPATSKIEYWITVITGDFTQDRALVTQHSITLTGLQASTTYTYNVYSEDEEYYYARLFNGKFTTLAIPPPPTATTTPVAAATTTARIATTTLSAPAAASAAATTTAAAASAYIPGTPASSANVRFRRDLSRGARGEDVRLLQRALIGWKFLPAGSDSGFFGSATQVGVRRLQQTLKFTPTGVLDSKTREYLNTLR